MPRSGKDGSQRETRDERRARELGITVPELHERRQKSRARREAKRNAKGHGNNRHLLTKEQATLADLYAEKYSTFDALRIAMVQNGVVEHRVSAFDVIQRAIDDTVTDYLLLRKRIEADGHGNIESMVEHPLYEVMERVREAMVRYSTFAMQYDIQMRQLKLSEARVGILSHTLRQVLGGLGLNQEQIRQVPKLLIEAIQAQEPNNFRATKLDPVKAEAIAEILGNDVEVEILDAHATDVEGAA